MFLLIQRRPQSNESATAITHLSGKVYGLQKKNVQMHFSRTDWADVVVPEGDKSMRLTTCHTLDSQMAVVISYNICLRFILSEHAHFFPL